MFMIRDDGVGMTQEQIQAALKADTKAKGGFGLSSVQQRIHLLYGDTFGLSIQSEPGRGTTVVIRIPVKE